MRILVVEDEAELGGIIARNLDRAGLAADLVGGATDAEAALRLARYDLVILDLGLPDGDGLVLLRELRARGDSVPVLILTARDSLEDRVCGLDAGADDYLLKPFAMAELIARVRTLLRRPRQTVDRVLRSGNLAFDVESRTVEVDGRPLLMGRREIALLEALMRSEGRIVTRDTLEMAVYGIVREIGPNAIEVAVHRLRREIEQAGAATRIHTVRGVGYMLEGK